MSFKESTPKEQNLVELRLELDEDLSEKLQWMFPDLSDYRIVRKSVDARGRRLPHFRYQVAVATQGEKLHQSRETFTPVDWSNRQPINIVGSGPAGLFAALRACEYGIPCRLFERGSESKERVQSINKFWRYGQLDPDNNVCFGEGGAGLYSDGKLITRIKSPHIPYVLQRLVDFGAPEEIIYLANPHVGSDRIRRLIPKIRDYLKANGCEIYFNHLVTDFIVDSSQKVTGVVTQNGNRFSSDVNILATGHSAEDILEVCHRTHQIAMEGKSFAIGLRIEHPQEIINRIQFKEAADHPKLGAANYKLTDHNHQTGVGVYSFCMCPGGYVLSSGTETDGIVSNGMSNYSRGSKWANAAIVVSVDHQKSFGDNLFGGLELRRNLERQAFAAVQAAGGSKEMPAQRLKDFINRTPSTTLPTTSCPSGIIPVRLDQILPASLHSPLITSLQKLQKSMPGFIHDDALLIGIETRTSCPVRILRDPMTFQSLSHPGLYPAGEGAGYAGGITSAACDGIQIIERVRISANTSQSK